MVQLAQLPKIIILKDKVHFLYLHKTHLVIENKLFY